MKKKPSTINDVALMSEVSVSTVSRFINKSGYVSTEVQQRISDAIAALDFVPSRIARALKDSRINEIGMVVPDIMNPYYAAAYCAAQECSKKYSYSVMLYNTGKKTDGETKSLEVFRNKMVDGLVYFSEKNNPDIIKHLKSLSIPVVLNAPHEPLIFDSVYSESGQGIYLATKHLCQLGHTHIAYSGGYSDSFINQNRREGFERALNEFGLRVFKDYIFEMAFSTDSGYKSGLFFNALSTPPTAIVAANDMIAMGVLVAMNEVGKRIPDDVSLTGEDNLDFTRICRPTLTTIDNDPAYLSERACEFLFDRLRNDYSGKPRIHICPRKLIIRDSTSSPKIV